MKLRNLFLPVLISGMASAGAESGVKLSAGLNMPTMQMNGGTAYLQLCLEVPAPPSHDRRPMNLSVVLDRSGSMSEQGKLEFAKRAICSLVDQLHQEDIFSLVIYDDVIEVPRPAGQVGDKECLKELVRSITPRNSTNLGGGMSEGFRQVERNIRREYVNRVILLSDGLANVGITNPEDLARIARQHRNRGVSLTSMGVGLDYNENLMVALSENGGGNYYFIESPNGIASILRREFDLLSAMYAHRATIDIHLGRGVKVIDVIGHEWHAGDGTCTISLGDLYGGDSRDVTIEIQIPAGSGTCEVADGTIRHESDKGGQSELATFSASVKYSSDVARVEKDRDMKSQSKADIAVSTRAVDKATRAIDDGRMEEATAIIGAAQQSLQASPAVPAGGATGAMVTDQAKKLERYRSMITNESDLRKVKKGIQYDNYQTQKKK